MNAWALMEKKYPRRPFTSSDEDVNSVARSQLRKRFDLGGDSTSTTQPNVLKQNERKTTRPKPNSAIAPAIRELVTSDAANDSSNESSRPTIPTPRPRISLAAVPRRLVDESQMMSMPLDSRAVFLLMAIDGKTALRSLIDVTGMAPEEVVVLVERLIELKAVAVL